MRRIFVVFVVCVAVVIAEFFKGSNSYDEDPNHIDVILPKSSNDEGMMKGSSFPSTKAQGVIIAGAYAANIPNIDATAIFQKSAESHLFQKAIISNAADNLQPERGTSGNVAGSSMEPEAGVRSHTYTDVQQVPSATGTHLSETALSDTMLEGTRLGKFQNPAGFQGEIRNDEPHDSLEEVHSTRESPEVSGPVNSSPSFILLGRSFTGAAPEKQGSAKPAENKAIVMAREVGGSRTKPGTHRKENVVKDNAVKENAVKENVVENDAEIVEDVEDVGYQAEEHHHGSTIIGMLIKGGAAVIGNVAGGIIRTGTGIVRTGSDVVGNVTSNVVKTGTGIIRTGTGIVGNVTSTVVHAGAVVVRTGTEIVGNVTSTVVQTGTGIVRTGSDIVENVGVGLVKTGVEIVNTGTELAEGVGYGIVHAGSDIVAAGAEIVRTGTGVVADVGSGLVKTGTEIAGVVGNDFVEKGSKIVGDVAKVVQLNINETAQNVRKEFTRHREHLELGPSDKVSSRSLETDPAVTSLASAKSSSSSNGRSEATNGTLFPPGLHV